MRRPARRVGVQPLLELTAHVEAEVAAGAEGEDRPVRDRLGRDEPSDGAGVLHAPAGLGHLLGQLALGADGELLDLAQRIELAHRDHGHVAAAQLPVDVGAEGTDLDEGDVEAHLAEPDDAGGDDRGEVPGEQDDARTPERLLREVGGVRLEVGQCLLGRDGHLAPGLEAGVVVGQRLGEGAAGRGRVLDRVDFGVGGAGRSSALR